MKFRLRVFLIHLVASLLVALAGLFLVFYIWHPNPLQKAVGVTHIFLLMLIVDAVVGPLLSLVVASSPEKKTLKMDLSVIIVLQLCAYLYGMHSIVTARPVYLAFDSTRIELVQANNVIRDKQKVIAPAYQSNPLFAPEWVSIRPYVNASEQSERILNELEGRVSPAMQANLYQPFDKGWDSMAKNKKRLADLSKFNDKNVVTEMLAYYRQADGYFPLKAPVQDMVVLIDSKNHQVVKIVDLRPW